MKFRLLLLPLFLGLLLLPSAARGQSQNCSAITFQLTSSVTTTHDCSTPSLSPSGNAYTTTWSFHVTCNNTQTGTIYQQNDISFADNGHCGPLTSGQLLNCPPSYTYSKTVPSTSSSNTYNQLNFQGIDNVMTGGGSPCVPMNGATAFVQCLTQACSSSPPPPPPPTCDPSCCNPCIAKQLGSAPGFIVRASSLNPKLQLVQSTRCCNESPILIDIGGQGFSLTSAASGVTFDMAGTGNPIQIAWTAPGANNAFLALPGADGLVHNGKELFGNFTPQPSIAIRNGFAALAVYDDPKNGGNADGVIDERDAIFSSLRLWIDTDHDGISQPNELFTLPSLGVNSISLNYKADLRVDQYGNLFRYRAQVNPGSPTNTGRMAYDVFFSTLTQAGSAILSAASKCTVPETKEERPAKK